MNDLDLDVISQIFNMYNSLQFQNFEFILITKKKLTEMIPLFDQPATFVKLFVVLGPVAGPEKKKE